MTLRNRVSVAAAVGVLIVVAVVSSVLYFFYAASLHSRVDAALVDAAQQASSIAQRIKQSGAGDSRPAPDVNAPVTVGSVEVQLFPGPVAAGQPTPFGPLDSQRCRGRRAGAAALLRRRARPRSAVPRLHDRLARQPRRAGAHQPGRERR